MTTLRHIALALHWLGLMLWLGGALSLTRVASSADESADPHARDALVAVCARLLRGVCVPWMGAALLGGAAALALGPTSRTQVLVASRAFWVELACGALLFLMQRALERRVRLVARSSTITPDRANALEVHETPETPQTPVRASAVHAPKLQRIQRVILMLSWIATLAAVSRR